MTKLFGLFLCRVWFRKHRRGIRIAHVAHIAGGPVSGPSDTYRMQCPRCAATWTRKSKPKPAEPVIPESIRRLGS